MERIAEVIHKLDNIIAATKLPLDPAFHFRGLVTALPDLREKLFAAYIANGGTDHWPNLAAHVEAHMIEIARGGKNSQRGAE